MELPKIEEFEEADLFRAGDTDEDDEDVQSAHEHVGAGDDSSSDFEVDMDNAPPRHSLDIHVPHSGSAKSTMLSVAREMFEEDLFGGDGMMDNVPSSSRRTIASSMPVAGNMRMGSSVPMNIPMYANWKKQETAAGNQLGAAGPAAAGTGGRDGREGEREAFVPPHQLSSQQNNQHTGFAFSLSTGESLVAMKRERLRARNAILKSTGFLEDGTPMPHGMSPEARLSFGGTSSKSFIAGGLSQALQGAAV